MTAPRDAIVLNNSTGSDTAASGLGPATAVGGAARAHTGGVSSTTITLNAATDLSGVQAGDIAWLKTASGRQFSVIASVNDAADTFVVDDAFTIDSGSPVDCWIGGKRATLDHADSRTLLADSKQGWLVQLEYTGSNYTLTSAISTVAQYVAIEGTGASEVVIEQTADAHTFGFEPPANLRFELSSVRLIHTGARTSSPAAIMINKDGPIFRLRSVRIGDATNFFHRCLNDIWGSLLLYAEGCEFIEASNIGIAGYKLLDLVGCRVSGNGSHGISVGNSGATPPKEVNLQSCVIAGNGGDGVNIADTTGDHRLNINGSVIHGNTGDGVDLAASSAYTGRVINSIFTDNGGYGINAASGQEGAGKDWWADYNAFRNNTSGARNNLTAGANDVTLTADPFTNAAANDFTLNNTAGGGAACRDAGFPQTIPGT